MNNQTFHQALRGNHAVVYEGRQPKPHVWKSLVVSTSIGIILGFNLTPWGFEDFLPSLPPSPFS